MQKRQLKASGLPEEIAERYEAKGIKAVEELDDGWLVHLKGGQEDHWTYDFDEDEWVGYDADGIALPY